MGEEGTDHPERDAQFQHKRTRRRPRSNRDSRRSWSWSWRWRPTLSVAEPAALYTRSLCPDDVRLAYLVLIGLTDKPEREIEALSRRLPRQNVLRPSVRVGLTGWGMVRMGGPVRCDLL